MAFDLRAPVPIRLERYINNIPIWESEERYNPGDVILHGNALFLSLSENFRMSPSGINDDWRHIGEGGGTNGIISALVVGETYSAGTFFYFENNLYVSSAQFVTTTGDTLESTINLVDSPLNLVTFNPEFTGIETTVIENNYNTGLVVVSATALGIPNGVTINGVNEGVRIDTVVRFADDGGDASVEPTYIVRDIVHRGNYTVFVLNTNPGTTVSVNDRVWIVQGSSASITKIDIAGDNATQLMKTLNQEGTMTISARTLDAPEANMPQLMTAGGIHNALPKVYVATGLTESLVGLESPVAMSINGVHTVSYRLPDGITEAMNPGIPALYFPDRTTDTGLRNDLTGDIGILSDAQFGPIRDERVTIIFTFRNAWTPPTPTDDGTDIDDHVTQVTEHEDPINSVSISARGSGYDVADDHLHISSQPYLDGRYAPLSSATNDDVTGYRIEEGEVLGWMVGDTPREGVVINAPVSGTVVVTNGIAQTFGFSENHGFADGDRFVIRLVHSAERWIYEVQSVINDTAVTANLRSTQPGAENPIPNDADNAINVEWAGLSVFDRGSFISDVVPTVIGTVVSLTILNRQLNGIAGPGNIAAIPIGSTLEIDGFTFVTGRAIPATNAGDPFSVVAVGAAVITAAVDAVIRLNLITDVPFNTFASGRGIAPFDIAADSATVSVENVLFPEGGEYPEALPDEATYTRGSVIVHDDKSWYFIAADDLIITAADLDTDLDSVRFRTRNDDGTFTFTNVVAANRTAQLALVAPGNIIPVARWQELGALESNAEAINFQTGPGVDTDTPISSISDVATVDSFLNLEYNGATGALQLSTHAALFRRILLTQGFLLPREPLRDNPLNGREAYVGNLGTGLDTDPDNEYWWSASDNNWYGQRTGGLPIVGF